jgi:hypothetical protein
MEVCGQHCSPTDLPPIKNAWYMLHKRLCGPQSQYRSFGDEKKSFPSLNQTTTPQLPSLQPNHYADYSTQVLLLNKERHKLWKLRRAYLKTTWGLPWNAKPKLPKWKSNYLAVFENQELLSQIYFHGSKGSFMYTKNPPFGSNLNQINSVHILKTGQDSIAGIATRYMPGGPGYKT